MIRSQTFGDYSLRDAEAIVRIFLPLISRRNPDRYSRWADIAEQTSGDSITATTSAVDLLNWGAGNGEFDSDWIPSSGSPPVETLASLRCALDSVIQPGAGTWLFRRFAEIPGCQHDNLAKLSVLDLFFEVWARGPLPGSLRNSTGLLLTSIPYADSVILSGPLGLIAAVDRCGLEFARASRWDQLPDLVWE